MDSVVSSHNDSDSLNDQLVPIDHGWKVAFWRSCYVRLTRTKVFERESYSEAAYLTFLVIYSRVRTNA